MGPTEENVLLLATLADAAGEAICAATISDNGKVATSMQRGTRQSFLDRICTRCGPTHEMLQAPGLTYAARGLLAN